MDFFTASGEPHSHQEALCDSRWKSTMDLEYGALMKNNTWHLDPPKKRANVIGCKLVYKVKKSDDSIDRYKAHLVAKSFKQHHGIDYEDTFSSMVKASTIRLLVHCSVEKIELETARCAECVLTWCSGGASVYKITT
jgi:hypothetical protein